MKLIDQLKHIIINAGDIMLKANLEEIDSHTKNSFRDIVTQYDVDVQNYIKQELYKIEPEANFIGEENVENSYNLTKAFIVDPIDGTANFRFGLNKSSCSIAYVENNQVLIGLVYDPFMKELFHAVRGEGAYLNNKRIKSMQGPLKTGVAIFGTNPYYENEIGKTFQIAQKTYEHTMDLRRFGSAALDICYVAAGRAIIFFEASLAPWDFAAGMLIASESKVLCTNWKKQELNLKDRQPLVVANPEALDEWLKLIGNK